GNDIDKTTTTTTTTSASTLTEEQPEVVRRTETNLAKPNKETTTTATPQDIDEQQQPATNQMNEDELHPEHGQQQQSPPATISHNWSPAESRQPRTPPAPQNSPVGYGLTASAAPPTVPPALAPLLQQQQRLQQQQKQQQQQPVSNKRNANAKNRSRNNSQNRNNNNSSSTSSNNSNTSNSNNSNNSRIIECDLIPSKKSKRKASKKQSETEPVEAMEATVREQIRDIKPLPGFQQAFGSTEIGRFSERFLQTPESLVERLAEEYVSSGSNVAGGGFYDATTAGGMHNYWPYEEPPSFPSYQTSHQQHQQMARSRMRGQVYPYPDYGAYERYGYAAYSANRSRYAEIRCNGY
ncbi:GH16530, partial [Drosophila grimshawi]